MFTDCLPHSDISGVSTEVRAARTAFTTITLNKITHFCGFEDCWKHLGSFKYTAQQNI